MNFKFQTQTGNLLYNDCSEASARNMIETYWGKSFTIMDVQRAIIKNSPVDSETGKLNSKDTFIDLQRGITELGFDTILTTGNWEIIGKHVGMGKPVICLVHYEKLLHNYIKYVGGHFVTIIDFDRSYVTYVDTLYTTLMSATKRITVKDFEKAWLVKTILYPKDKQTIQPEPVPPIIEDLEMTKEEYAAVEGAKIRAELLLKGEVLRFWKYKDKATVYVGKPEDKTKPIPNELVLTLVGANWDEVKVV